MINAESFKNKIQKRIDLIKKDIHDHIQEVLNNELQKDNVTIPCNVKFNSSCFENQEVLKSILNMLGFKSTIIDDSKDNFIVSIDYVSSGIRQYDYNMSKIMIEEMQKQMQNPIAYKNSMYTNNHLAATYNNSTISGNINVTGTIRTIV